MISRYLLFALVINTSFSQTLKFHSEHSISSPSAVSKDESGNIYYADDSGNIFKLTKFGKLISDYSPNNVLKFTYLEAGQSLRVFAFSSVQQRYYIFDRFLNLSSKGEISKDGNSFISAATQGKDNNLWLYDETKYSLIKFNPTIETIVNETPLELILNTESMEINYMVEYRNRLYISGPDTGVMIFDNLGSYIGKLTSEPVEIFDFDKDWVYYLKGNQILFFNMYTEEKKAIEITSNNPLFIIYTSELIYLFSESILKIYRLISD